MVAGFLSKLGNAAPDPGHVPSIRIAVVGEAGVGKSTLVNLISTGKPPGRGVRSTVGCQVAVKLVIPAPDASSSGSSAGASSGDQSKFFVELWDVSGSDYYSGLRQVCYRQLNGVILVHDAGDRGSLRRLQKWAVEVATSGTFVAPFADEVASKNIGGLPVPVLVIGNKSDRRASSSGSGASSGSSGSRAPGSGAAALCARDAVAELCTGWLRRGQGPVAFLRQRVRASDASLVDMEKHVHGLQASAATGQLDWGLLESFFSTLWTRRYQPSSAHMAAPAFVAPMRSASSSAAADLGLARGGSDNDRLDDDWV